MDRNAYRDGNGTGQPDANQADTYQSSAYQPDAYWRRRVITLCAGLVLLGLLAWAFSGGGGKPAAVKKAAQASGALPTAAYSSAPAGAAAAGAAATHGAAANGAPAFPSAGADASSGTDASASAGSSASLPFLTASPSPGASTPGNSASSQRRRGRSQRRRRHGQRRRAGRRLRPGPGVAQLEPHHRPARLRHGGIVGAAWHVPSAGQGRQRGQPGPHLQTGPLGLGAQDGGERLADVLHLLHLSQPRNPVGTLQGRS
jgi:hypothetical protein